MGGIKKFKAMNVGQCQSVAAPALVSMPAPMLAPILQPVVLMDNSSMLMSSNFINDESGAFPVTPEFFSLMC